MTEILDKSYNKDGELTQFLIFDGNQPRTKLANPKNMLLYDPEDELPFDGGMDDLLEGNSAYQIHDSPKIVVSQTDEYSYVLSIGAERVETTPKQASELLQGVYDTIAENDAERLEQLHRNIIKNQVRRQLVNTLKGTFDGSKRINVVENGWLVDEFYLVDWNAKMYAANDDPEEDDYVRSGSEAVKKDESFEFVKLQSGHSMNGITVSIDGVSYTLSEREMMFLGKITWLLGRRQYHPDEPFWDYADRWADLPEEEPSIESFEL